LEKTKKSEQDLKWLKNQAIESSGLKELKNIKE